MDELKPDPIIDGYTLEQLAPYFSLSEVTLRRKLFSGEIGLKVFSLTAGRKGRLFVSTKEWRRYLASREKEGVCYLHN